MKVNFNDENIVLFLTHPVLLSSLKDFVNSIEDDGSQVYKIVIEHIPNMNVNKYGSGGEFTNVVFNHKDYTKICPSCYHFDIKDGTCDMCAWGHPTAIDNNGFKQSEVTRCDYN